MDNEEKHMETAAVLHHIVMARYPSGRAIPVSVHLTSAEALAAISKYIEAHCSDQASVADSCPAYYYEIRQA